MSVARSVSAIRNDSVCFELLIVVLMFAMIVVAGIIIATTVMTGGERVIACWKGGC